MKLDKPSLPIEVPKEDALSQIKETVEEKQWPEEEYSIEEPTLLFVPFFVFNYEAFTETKTEEGDNPIVSETQNGRMAMNAFDSELDEETAQLFEEEELNLEKKVPKEVAFEMQKTRLKDDEAKQLAQIKMAAQLSLGKGNVIISALELIYVPYWISFVKIGEEEYRVELNAVSGAMEGLEELPERGKSYGEAAKETLSELKDPFAWLKYAFSIIVDVAKWIWNSGPVKWVVEQLKTNPRFQIAVLLAILILIFLGNLP